LVLSGEQKANPELTLPLKGDGCEEEDVYDVLSLEEALMDDVESVEYGGIDVEDPASDFIYDDHSAVLETVSSRCDSFNGCGLDLPAHPSKCLSEGWNMVWIPRNGVALENPNSQEIALTHRPLNRLLYYLGKVLVVDQDQYMRWYWVLSGCWAACWACWIFIQDIVHSCRRVHFSRLPIHSTMF
jgi:hypothetical protein